jgi:hypothetical protein
MAAEANELREISGGCITDTVAGWLAAQYLAAAREKLNGTEGSRRWEILRAFAQDWNLLRRGDHSAASLQLDREELDWRHANSKMEKEREFWEWIKRPEIQTALNPNSKPGLSEETLRRIESELRLL